MSIKRPITVIAAFAVCLGVVLATMGYLSATALRLDRSEAEARQRAIIEENVRLALWRMDSLLAPIVAAESALPPAAFVAAERRQMEQELQGVGQQAAGPFAAPLALSPFVEAYFQVGPTGDATLLSDSAQGASQLATANADNGAHIETALGELSKTVQVRQLLAAARGSALADANSTPATVSEDSGSMATPPQFPPLSTASKAQVEEPFSQKGQGARNTAEYNARSQIVQGNRQAQIATNAMYIPDVSAGAAEMMTPLWVGDSLTLVREVDLGGQSTLQGCVLDWPAISAALTKSIADLFPHARLEAVSAENNGVDESRRLASLPVRLSLGPTQAPPVEGWSPVEISLIVAWACVLTAAAAVAVLLYGVVMLSERRAAFVSAVTHELRTPLTTLRMYSEMLCEGMAPDESQRREYMQTLHREANRLWHLVENVLAYARLERGRGGRIEELGAADFLDHARMRLVDRAEDAGLTLDAVVDDGARDAVALADAGATEQILFNLVDNACKYAADSSDKTVHIRLSTQGGWVVFEVADHGPGIQPRTARRLSRPFSKSAEDAAHTAPGVGLGLALCRRLAKQMGGRLVVMPPDGRGARIELRLPAGRPKLRGPQAPAANVPSRG